MAPSVQIAGLEFFQGLSSLSKICVIVLMTIMGLMGVGKSRIEVKRVFQRKFSTAHNFSSCVDGYCVLDMDFMSLYSAGRNTNETNRVILKLNL